MMEEHLAVLNISAAGNQKFAVPKGGVVKGVYASNPITISLEENGTVGVIKTAVTEWEPVGAGYTPAPIAYVHLTTTAATNVTIRYEL